MAVYLSMWHTQKYDMFSFKIIQISAKRDLHVGIHMHWMIFYLAPEKQPEKMTHNPIDFGLVMRSMCVCTKIRNFVWWNIIFFPFFLRYFSCDMTNIRYISFYGVRYPINWGIHARELSLIRKFDSHRTEHTFLTAKTFTSPLTRNALQSLLFPSHANTSIERIEVVTPSEYVATHTITNGEYSSGFSMVAVFQFTERPKRKNVRAFALLNAWENVKC